MLDEIHQKLYQDPQDHNHYTFGKIGEHNVVIACLAFGRTGLVSATEVAMEMKLSFKSIRFGLMVGVGGGVPSEEVDIRLGDVVVSRPFMNHPGMIQYDLSKTGPSGQNVRTGSLNFPPQILLNALTAMEANSWRGQFDITKHAHALGDRLPKFTYHRGLVMIVRVKVPSQRCRFLLPYNKARSGHGIRQYVILSVRNLGRSSSPTLLRNIQVLATLKSP